MASDLLAWIGAADLRWLSASCHIFIGLTLIALAIHVWWMPLHKRAVLFEPYLTAEGVKLLLTAWPLVFVAGVFLCVAGLSKWAYYLRWHGTMHDNLASGIGTLEAIFSVWAACSVAVVTVRAWRKA